MCVARAVPAALLLCLPLGSSLPAQQPAAPPRRGMDLEAVRRAVVTVHALDASGQRVASGTGFFVDILPTMSIVVTAAHVLEGAAGCSIELADEQTLRCTPYAADSAKDVLMLKVAAQPPGTLAWGTSGSTRDGEDITVVSNPLGQLPGTISKGIISARRVVRGTMLFQITAPISHGSSGAPVLNAEGRVIGVVRSTIEEGQALNFATATDAVRNLWQDQAALGEAQAWGGAAAGVAAARGAAGATPSSRVTGGPATYDIRVGGRATGTLVRGDSVYSDSTYYQVWRFSPTAGRWITIDLSSDEFDPVLIVRGLDSSLVNDDGGPGCAARVVYQFPGAGPYRILVNTTSTPKWQTGRFALSVTEGRSELLREDRCTAGTAPAAGVAPAVGAAIIPQIRIGQQVTGTLTSADSVYADSTYYELWQFSPAAGRWITIDLSSDEFDPMIIVRGLDSSLINDDGGPGCASRVVYQYPGAGPYRVLVNTTSTPKWQTGRFTLSVTEGRSELLRQDRCAAAESGTSSGRTIAIGQTVQGQLTRSDHLRTVDSTYAQSWALKGVAGRTVTIDLESDAFDAYVFLMGPGFERNPQDDDSGGSCNARLTTTLPQTGEYTIVVNTQDRYATGAFALSVTAGSKPKSLTRCNQSR